MSTAEHLDRIVAKCRELLADAEARRQDFIEHGFTFDHPTTVEEAGWRATIAAIEWALEIDHLESDMVEIIIAAWPEEIL